MPNVVKYLKSNEKDEKSNNELPISRSINDNEEEHSIEKYTIQRYESSDDK